MMNPLFTSRPDRVAANDGQFVGNRPRPEGEPAPTAMLREGWYVAAWSHEVPMRVPLERIILGECVSLSRRGEGVVFADWPIVERGGIVWIWMGDPLRADAARIPELPCVDGPSWVLGVTDMDQTRDPERATAATLRAARSRLFIRNESLPPALSLLTGLPESQRCNRWIDVRWEARGGLLLQADVVPVGQPRERGVRTWHLQARTPSTPGKARCFYALSLPPAGPPGRMEFLLDDARELRARRAYERCAAWEHVVEATSQESTA